MNKHKRIVVNFASGGRENYIRGSQRLFDSAIEVGLDADMLICSPDLQDSGDYIVNGDMTLFLRRRWPTSKEWGDCPSHQYAPYAFKSYIMQEARDMGYEKVMWADSSTVFLKNPEKYWELAEEIGVVLLDNPGCPEATWTSDDCLEHMGCDKEFAKTFFEIDAFMMIFDFSVPVTDPLLWERFGYSKNSKPVANMLFDNYFEHSRDGICLLGQSGSTRENFQAHRHDQSIASYFAKLYNILPINYGAWCYANEVGVKFNPTFVKVGISQPFDWKNISTMHKNNINIMGKSYV